MAFLIAILVVLILSINIAYIFDKRIEYTLPITSALVSLVLYVFTFFGARSMGVIFLLMLLVLSIAYSVYKIVHRHDSIKEVFRSAGLIYFVVMIIVTFIIAHGFMFSSWDEFSHWGLILKDIFISNGFGNLSSATTFSYPPGVSLFLSFFTHFSNVFLEQNALRGIILLACSQMAIVFVGVKHNDWKKIFLLSTILFILPTIFFSSFYSTIYVDAFMGLIFCNILYFNYLYRKKDLFYAIYIGLQFYLLANTKQIGIGMVMIAFIAILIDFIYSNKVKHIKSFLINKKNELIFLLLPLLAALLTNISWAIYIKCQHISEIVKASDIKLSDVLSFFRGDMLEYRNTTVVNFVTNFFSEKQYGAVFFSYFLIATALLLVMYYLYKNDRTDKQKTFALQLFASLGLFVYSGVILFMYLFVFSEYEAIHLASMDRYIGTYILGLLALSVFLLINYIIKSRGNRCSPNFKIAFLFILLMCFVPVKDVVNDTILSSSTNKVRQQNRTPYYRAEQFSKSLDPKKDRVYIISQMNNGEDYWKAGYALTPIQTSPNNGAWSLGMPYTPTDIWTVNKTAKEWSDDLKSYSYVYLQYIDDRFVNDYGQLFENISDIRSRDIYSIDKSGGRVILKDVSDLMMVK
ncbi:MAG: hypothetical protein WCJ36_00655 [Candidatus Saccharibacteria bacterium]